MPSDHPHSHGPDPDAPPPSPELVTHRRRAVWLMLLVLVPIGLATIVGLFVLWPSGEPTKAQQGAETLLPPGTTYPDARIVSIETVDCSTDPAQPVTCSTAVVEVLDGDGAGEFQQIELPPDVTASGVERDDEIVLSRDGGAESGPTYGFFDYQRDFR